MGDFMRILKLTITAEEEGKKVKQLMRGTWQISSGLLKSLKWRENANFMERIEGMGRTPLFSNKTSMLENIFSCP